MAGPSKRARQNTRTARNIARRRQLFRERMTERIRVLRAAGEDKRAGKIQSHLYWHENQIQSWG